MINTTSRPTTRRPPLGEATRRVNNAKQQQQQEHQARYEQKAISYHTNEVAKQTAAIPEFHPQLHGAMQQGSDASNAVNPRLSAIAQEHPASNRNSQISTTSTNSEGKRLKSYIGPWKLGKTLGKGATARVRLARHAVTGQEAAVKIVQKKNAQLSQAGSLAAFDKAESNIPDSGDGLRRMPVGIEREVAIMKLIQHPNIMKLHDIWENRTEIYLVLEYVENGELFDHISNSVTGNLPEEEALRCFRQILSAVGYCHSFHICHRDLKPENILLTKTGQIKIADFGMAALHQGPDHKLETSCGSPHYAAPELIRGAAYKGDMVDIWSMGVILYATLAGRLPFDVEGSSPNLLGALLAKIKKGQYEMPYEFSSEAKSLIRRMLQVNPKDRITLPQIWKHPLMRKYDYLDDLSGSSFPPSPSLKQCGRPVLKRSDISKDLLRNLRSLWHKLSEQQLLDALLSDEPNEQKLFYSLLVKYRDAQLENYAPDVGYSASDYHHTKPFNLTKTYSTCHFQPTKLKGHARQTSKFTVISNGGDTERSYDPFKASRPQHLNHPHSGHVTVTIHHEENSTRIPRPSTASRPKSQTSSIAISNDHQRQQSLAPPKFYSSRSSMASSTRSRSSNPHLRAGLGYKRGVSFSHVRRNSAGTQLQQFDISTTPTRGSRHRNNAESTKDSSDMVHKVNNPQPVTQYIRSKKAPMGGSRTLPSPVKPGRVSLIWSEDVRKLSTSLAKDCDEAFNRTSVVTEVDTSEISGPKTKTSTLSKFNKKIETPSQIGSKSSHPQAPTLKGDHMSLKDRPLPRAPARTESVEMELKEAKKLAEQRQKAGNGDSFHYLDRMVSHIDELIQPLSPGRARRVISAPVDTKRTSLARPLPSIHEAQGENPSPGRRQGIVSFQEHNRRVETKNNRTASAPEPRDTGRLRHDHRYTEPNPLSRETIRVVTSTSFESPVKPPAPLFIRKKSSQTGPTTTMPGVTGVERDDQPNWERASGTSSWGLFQECNQDTQPNWHQPLKVGLREEFKAADCKTHPNWHRLSGVSLQGQNQTAARTPIGEDRSLTGEEHNDEYDVATESTSGTVVKKRSGWFKRSPKLEEEGLRASLTDAASALNSDIIQSPYERPANPDLLTPNIQAPKKKGFSFGRIFKKRNSKLDMALSTVNTYDDNASVQDSITEPQQQPCSGQAVDPGDGRVRQIAPQRNWLAKLFNVTPTARFICFSVSKQKARREITAILKDWKRYGIRDIQVDKDRNIVFGRVAAQNYLQMKEVAFASEVMTVIEHGKRSPLSIARFTQEQGAATSFQKVVETLEAVLKCRGVLLHDERKKRMMIKTLNST